MTFLQPWVLAALPLMALPLIIHLINQRRFQTVPWAAMQFLLAAKALSRGYSRLRHWLIMALRMLAVAAVILAVGRPLSRGWLALAAGGRPDSAIVILDRSPSMQAMAAAGGVSKLDTGRRQLAASLATLRAGRVLVLSDPAQGPEEVASPEAIADLAAAGPVAASADLPALLQAAYEFIRENAAGTTEIWICSDQRANDWKPDDGGWSGIRDALAKLPQQVRVQLLSYAMPAKGNVAVRASSVKLETLGRDRRLVVTVTVSRQEDGERTTIPVRFEIGGVSTAVDVELAGREAVLKNHVIPLERSATAQGFGTVSIPADADLADNEFFFVYDEPPPRRSLVVAQDPAAGRVLELVAAIAPDKAPAPVDLVPVGGLAAAAWDSAAAVLWQGPLPEGRDADLVRTFLDRGGQVVFFPPEGGAGGEFAGGSWGEWTDHPAPVAAESWRTDQDLLANTLAGSALPLGDVEVRRSCGLAGDLVPLASLPGAAPLVARSSRDDRVTFVATTPAARDSSLAAEGIVLYALVQRAIDRGLTALGHARQIDAGPAAVAVGASCGGGWTRLTGPAGSPSTEAGLHAGVFACGERLAAVNRPAVEDSSVIVADERIDGLFRGLSFTRITGTAGDTTSLVQEIWRAFLIAMLLALVAEGLLSLPRPASADRVAKLPRPLEAAA
ncbi:MAG: BatA domain-containing protein [Planctomycetaceae bacterium]